MKRYKKANEGIHAPEDAKEKAARPAGKPSRARWMGAVAAMLAVVILGGVALWPRQPNVTDPLSLDGPRGFGPISTARATTLAAAQYPEMVPCPVDTDYVVFGILNTDRYYAARREWSKSVNSLSSGRDYAGLLDGYLSATAAQFLTGEGSENRVYSPLNIYMALAMLCETTDGASRDQLLTLLGADSVEEVRALARDLWRDNYRDDGQTASVLANSMWLNDTFDGHYVPETLDTLAADYYASAFSGECGTPEYDQALRDWINGQTHNLLEEYSKELSLNRDTVLALVSTLYYQAKWADAFDPSLTFDDDFHAPGGTVTADFMHQTLEDHYYWAERFGAVRLYFEDYDYKMWILLPDEGVAPEELIADGSAMDFLTTDLNKTAEYDPETDAIVYPWGGSNYYDINLTLPKFDISTGIDLIEGLKALGVTDVFDMYAADFTPLTDLPLVYVSQAQHAARVIVEEEKVEAAAYTILSMEAGAAAPPDDEVYFTVDRPFIFAITGPSGLPLFVGVVNQPNG